MATTIAAYAYTGSVAARCTRSYSVTKMGAVKMITRTMATSESWNAMKAVPCPSTSPITPNAAIGSRCERRIRPSTGIRKTRRISPPP